MPQLVVRFFSSHQILSAISWSEGDILHPLIWNVIWNGYPNERPCGINMVVLNVGGGGGGEDCFFLGGVSLSKCTSESSGQIRTILGSSIYFLILQNDVGISRLGPQINKITFLIRGLCSSLGESKCGPCSQQHKQTEAWPMFSEGPARNFWGDPYAGQCFQGPGQAWWVAQNLQNNAAKRKK